MYSCFFVFFFSSRRRHTRYWRDWSSDVCSSDLEEFLRKNIEVIFEDETLLVVGKQVVNKENGRSDLTAVDENGNLVLIEVKRDVEDIRQRKESFEFQAIRYAASYAKIKTPDDLRSEE